MRWPVYDIVEFCRDTLNIRHDLDIIVVETSCLEQEGAMGWTYNIQDGEIDIEIDKNLSFQDKILTLCHEMVHAWQFSQDRKSDEDEALKLETELYNKYKEKRLC
jgi:Zn-dependent peptidase ImmA (M78 family)